MSHANFINVPRSLLRSTADSRRRRAANRRARPSGVEALEPRMCLSATLTLSGTFDIESIESPPGWTVGPDLAAAFGHLNGWTCTLQGVRVHKEAGDSAGTTSVFADSFTFEFTGPDAATLNEVAGQYFADNGYPFLSVSHDDASGMESWSFWMAPYDGWGGGWPYPGVFFAVYGTGQWATDSLGCPVIETMSFPAGSTTVIYDERGGITGFAYHGTLTSYNDPVAMVLDGEPEVVVAPPLLFVSATEVGEGDSAAEFVVSLSRASDDTVTASFTTVDGTGTVAATGGSDFQPVSGTVSFAPGERSKTVAVPLIGDLTDEYDEHFRLVLTGATNANFGDSFAWGTIVDDDAPPAVVVGDVSKAEGRKWERTAFEFVVSLSAPSGKEVRVSYSTANGTATLADADYFATSGELVFAPGETTKRVTVVVNGDNRKEANETFFLDLFDVSEAVLGDDRGIGTILSDDPR